jgi:Fic family protein
MGRLLIPLLLCERDRLVAPLLYMSAYFEKYRTEYVDGLLRVSTHGDWNAWVAFFLKGVAASALESLSLAEELLALRERYHQAVRSARSSSLLGTLIDELFSVPTLTISQAARITAVTAASASSNLQKLVELGIVTETTGRQRGQIFMAKEILGFFGRDLGTPKVGTS